MPPATEQTWRGQKRMHVIFGVISVLMLITTVWMFAVDHAREWKDFQKTAYTVDQFYAVGRVNEAKTAQANA